MQLNHNHVTMYSSINRVQPPSPPLDPRTCGGHSSRHPFPPSGTSWSLPRAASITGQYTAQSTGCSSLCLRCCLSLFVPVPNFLGWGRGSVATHLVFECTRRHGAQALWVSCGLDRLSYGSVWRSYLYPFISPAPGIAARCSRPALSCQRHRHPRTWRANTIITRADRSGCAVTFTPSSHLRCYLYTFLPYLTLF